MIGLPDKKYFVISEVATYCDVKPDTLRYWEKVFVQLRPQKMSKRRYYSKKDIRLVILIRRCLYELGYTPAATKKKLAQGKLSIDNAYLKTSDVLSYTAPMELPIQLAFDTDQILNDIASIKSKVLQFKLL